MTRRDKLVDRIRARPVEADFDDLRHVLERYGWRLRAFRGSHATFVKEGETRPFVVPTIKGRRVKRPYLDTVCELLALDD